MAIQLIDNFKYLGGSPNFERDRFQTVEDMEAAGRAGHLDVGHICYIAVNGEHYEWRGAGEGCKPFPSITGGGGEGGSSVQEYRGGAGIGVSGSSIYFRYGTGLGLNEEDDTIGLMYDDLYFDMNPSQEASRTGLTLRVSKRGGLGLQSSGVAEEQGLRIKHNESLGIATDRYNEGTLGVRVSTNLKVTEKGLALQLGTDKEAETVRGLNNSPYHGLGVATGKGVKIQSDDCLGVNIKNEGERNALLMFGTDGALDLRYGNGLQATDKGLAVKYGTGLGMDYQGNLYVLEGKTYKGGGGISVTDDGTILANIGASGKRRGLVNNADGELGVYCGTGLKIENEKLDLNLGGGQGIAVDGNNVKVRLAAENYGPDGDTGADISGLEFASTGALKLRLSTQFKVTEEGLQLNFGKGLFNVMGEIVVVEQGTTIKNSPNGLKRVSGNAIKAEKDGLTLKLGTGVKINDGYLAVDVDEIIDEIKGKINA